MNIKISSLTLKWKMQILVKKGDSIKKAESSKPSALNNINDLNCPLWQGNLQEF